MCNCSIQSPTVQSDLFFHASIGTLLVIIPKCKSRAKAISDISIITAALDRSSGLDG